MSEKVAPVADHQKLSHSVEVSFARFSVKSRGEDSDSVVKMMTKIFSPRNGLFWLVTMAIVSLWIIAFLSVRFLDQSAVEVLSNLFNR